jgi:HPr kinase/phosphorylase
VAAGGAGVKRDPAASVHATAIVVREAGILIRGPSGVGKSSLALRLLAAAEGRGWFARLVGDDRLLVAERHGALLAAPHPALEGLIERRTQPFARLPFAPRCRVRLLVDLLAASEPALPRLPDGDVADGDEAGYGAGLPRLRLQGPADALWCGIIFDKLAAS